MILVTSYILHLPSILPLLQQERVEISPSTASPEPRVSPDVLRVGKVWQVWGTVSLAPGSALYIRLDCSAIQTRPDACKMWLVIGFQLYLPFSCTVSAT